MTEDAILGELAGLRALARSLVHGDADADDLLQETAIVAMQDAPDDARPVRPWLAGVLRNRWRMDRRSRARRIAREQASVEDVVDAPTDAIDRARTLEKLAAALVALDEPFRVVVVRRYLDGKSAADIACELGLPAGTVRWRLKTGLERLRKSLDESMPRWQRALAPLVSLKGVAVVKAKTTIIPLIILLFLVAGGGLWLAHRRDQPTAPAHNAAPVAAGSGSARAKIVVELATAAPGEPDVKQPNPGQGRVVVEPVDAAGGLISGHVVNWSTGEPVDNAELTFTTAAGATTVRTTKGGAFELSPPAPGTYSLATIIAPNFLPYAPELAHSPVRIALGAKQAVRGLTLFLQPALDYAGKVVDASGMPVAGARVKLADPPSGEQALEKIVTEWTTDKQGQFVFHAPDGSVFEATRGKQRGWAMLDGNVATTHKMTIKIGDAAARDATIKGKTVDPAGAPIADVLVTAVPSGPPGPQTVPRSVAFATSGNDGTFVLEGLDKEAYILIAEDEDHAPSRKDNITGGTQAVTLTLDGGLPLAGLVEDADDKPVPSYTLLVAKREGLVREVVTTRSVIDPRGHFDIRVAKGKYELLVFGNGLAPSAPVAADAGTTDTKIRLSAGATLKGVVVDSVTGAALPYARVQREGAGGGATTMSANAGTVTREDGTFVLTGIPPGPFTISIVGGEYNPKLEAGLVATEGGALGPIRIALTKLKEGEEPKIELVGIGVKLSADGEALKIEMVAPGSGAEAAGIVVGDHLVSVDGVPVTQLGIDGAVARIRGVAGTTLSVGLQRGDAVQVIVVERKPLRF